MLDREYVRSSRADGALRHGEKELQSIPLIKVTEVTSVDSLDERYVFSTISRYAALLVETLGRSAFEKK